jgi:hypothetical protein
MLPTLPLTECGGGSSGSWSSSLRAPKHSFTTMCSGSNCSLATESRWSPHDDEHGEIRSSVLRQVKPCDSYYNPGGPFFAEIALHGPFRHVPELLYFRRDHPERGDRSATVNALCSRMDPMRAGQSTARLYAEYVLGYFDAIRRAPIPIKNRAACSLLVLRWLVFRGVSTLRGMLRR